LVTSDLLTSRPASANWTITDRIRTEPAGSIMFRTGPSMNKNIFRVHLLEAKNSEQIQLEAKKFRAYPRDIAMKFRAGPTGSKELHSLPNRKQ